MDIALRTRETPTACGVKDCGKDTWTEIQVAAGAAWDGLCLEHLAEVNKRIECEFIRQLSPLFNTERTIHAHYRYATTH